MSGNTKCAQCSEEQASRERGRERWGAGSPLSGVSSEQRPAWSEANSKEKLKWAKHVIEISRKPVWLELGKNEGEREDSGTWNERNIKNKNKIIMRGQVIVLLTTGTFLCT